MYKFTVLNEQRRPDNQLLTTTTETDESDDLKKARAFMSGSRSVTNINAAVLVLTQLLPEISEYSRIKTDYTYYTNGDIDTITVTELDNLGNVLSVKKIKHPAGGGQPHLIL